MRQRLYKFNPLPVMAGGVKDMLNTPTQMCQFHLVAIVVRTLRKKHQSHTGRELKSIIKTLKTSSRN